MDLANYLPQLANRLLRKPITPVQTVRPARPMLSLPWRRFRQDKHQLMRRPADLKDLRHAVNISIDTAIGGDGTRNDCYGQP